MANYLDLLFENSDEKYKEFITRLNPSVDKNTILGVRMPIIKLIAKNLTQTEKQSLLNDLPHEYFEQYYLQAIVIGKIKDWNTALIESEKLLPFINNWAISDTLNPKILMKKPKDLETLILEKYLKSPETYTIRYGLVLLLRYYCDDPYFTTKHFKVINSIENDDYYTRMAIAWYYSYALIKQWDKTIPYFKKLTVKNKWIHNKSLQKATESFRITADKKILLKTLKIK